jgi:carbamoyltransferase
MGYTLGIHVGHDASCAIVYEGRLVAAIQQERITRQKHDGAEGLTNHLPVNSCLRAAGIRVSDVDHIVSSFQSVAPAGFGLHRPLVYPDFDLFDPWDPRHFVISHHLAHAYCTFCSSGFDEAAILICDLGGSSTLDGKDFQQPFAEWYAELTQLTEARAVQTESLSFYDATDDKITLLERDFCIPHSVPESFVQNPCSLYDNVSRCVFGHENAHGQLMALAGLNGVEGGNELKLTASDIVEVTPDDHVIFRNNWQQRIDWGMPIEHQANLAHASQRATEEALMAYVRRMRHISARRDLAVAGGIFLNILSNTKIAESGLFGRYYVPSAPHDAGISVGCAFFGDGKYGSHHRVRVQSVCDRLGRLYEPSLIEREMAQCSYFVRYSSQHPLEVAGMLRNGEIVARWSGRAEFGPRALGGRSLLGSPLLLETKDRMNHIKGRQAWRPVAPVVPQESFTEFFSGPADSPYMTFRHGIRAEHVKVLPALHHADGSTRAQSLLKEDDAALYQLLLEFGDLTGYPILVNTSMNGAKEPIIETPREALRFFLTNEGVDALLLDSWLVTRRDPWECEELKRRKIRLADGCLISVIFPKGVKRVLVSRGSTSLEVSHFVLEILFTLGEGRTARDVLSDIMVLPNANDICTDFYNLLLREIVVTD